MISSLEPQNSRFAQIKAAQLPLHYKWAQSPHSLKSAGSHRAKWGTGSFVASFFKIKFIFSMLSLFFGRSILKYRREHTRRKHWTPKSTSEVLWSPSKFPSDSKNPEKFTACVESPNWERRKMSWNSNLLLCRVPFHGCQQKQRTEWIFKREQNEFQMENQCSHCPNLKCCFTTWTRHFPPGKIST